MFPATQREGEGGGGLSLGKRSTDDFNIFAEILVPGGGIFEI
jgi:hypothetical protein